MRNPVRSEADAFRIAYGGAAVIGAAVAVGALAGPIAGAALFAGACLGMLLWQLATEDPQRRRPLSEAASQHQRGDDGRHRVLVVANETLRGDELHRELCDRGTPGTELRIIAPVLASRVHYLASDVDRELDDARARLEAALEWARAAGFAATGRVGDPNAALGAIEDELRLFGADEIVLSTHPPGRSNWLETGIVERLRDELDIPVTHVVVDLDRAAVPTG